MKVKIDNAPYEVPTDFTYRELGLIKRVSGLRPAELEDALPLGDAECLIAVAVISAQRAGVELDADDLLDRPAGAITFEGDDDEDRPTEAPEPDESGGES